MTEESYWVILSLIERCSAEKVVSSKFVVCVDLLCT